MRNGARGDCTKETKENRSENRGGQTREKEAVLLEGLLVLDGEQYPLKVEAKILCRTRKAVKVELSDRYDLNLLSNLLGRPVKRQCCLPELSWEALLAAI